MLTNAPGSDHVSTLEAARRLGMAVRSVQLMVDRGELLAWKTPGGHRRILRSSLERWLAEHQGGVGAAAAAAAAAAEARPAGKPPRAARTARGASGDVPAPPTSAAPPRSPPARADAAGPARPAAGDGHTPRALLIEDSVHYQTLVGMLVRKHQPGLELHVAGDGIAGLAMAGELQPELLLVDILLPGIDGATLITGLRSHPQFRRSRLIVVTSLDEAAREPYALALADVPVVHKSRLVTELPPLLERGLAQAHQARLAEA